MRKAGEAVLMLVSGFVALLTGVLLIMDFQILTGQITLNYKHPKHDHNVYDAVMSSNLAPVLHLLVFTASFTVFLRLWRK